MAIQIADSSNFKALTAEDLVIVDFYTTTCVPCKLFAKILEDVAAETPFLNIVKVNLTDCPEIGQELGINAVPTVHIYQDGKLVMDHTGVLQAEDLKAAVAQYLYG